MISVAPCNKHTLEVDPLVKCRVTDCVSRDTLE